ncbi:TetR/AcrR family transcriptional regulator [Catenuloplanes sp. NPDC051500]|uniref:TetR/AcrR family transcriptional regulator n=1 Tax=Catenuloplanes sp. NPDC051500 TaxID=3363959 RepID=UPI0037919C71
MRAALDAEAIMIATEDVLRKHGPAKATVVDVARVLGVSHAAVYRHFPSKAALREAVARRWLNRNLGDLAGVASSPARPAPERLRTWITLLFHRKREGAVTEPDLFATVGVLAKENSIVITEHIETLYRQLETIIEDGIVAGDFAFPGGAPAAARAVFDATQAFHAPQYAAQWPLPDRDAALTALCVLILNGLRPA